MLALCCIVLICVEITTGFKLLDIRSSSGKRQLDIVIVRLDAVKGQLA